MCGGAANSVMGEKGYSPQLMCKALRNLYTDSISHDLCSCHMIILEFYCTFFVCIRFSVYIMCVAMAIKHKDTLTYLYSQKYSQ